MRVWVRVFLPLLTGWCARPGRHGLLEFMRGGPPPWLLISEPPWARRGAFPSRWRKVDRGAWQRTALARTARLSLIQTRVWLEGLHALSPSGAGIWWTCGRGMVARSDSYYVGRDSTRAWHRCADARRTTSLSLSFENSEKDESMDGGECHRHPVSCRMAGSELVISKSLYGQDLAVGHNLRSWTL